MSGQNHLQINAPQDMYTMSDQRVIHIIQPHEWVEIKRCAGSELREWAIGLCGGSLGFIQNVYNVWHWAYKATPITGWDVLGSLFFVALAMPGVALFVVSWRKKGEFAALIAEIDKRQPQPFSPGPVAPPVTGPSIRGRSIDAILQDATTRTPQP